MFGASNSALREQLELARVSDREFTSGGCVFLRLGYQGNTPLKYGGSVSYLDGPEIQSPEMSTGALATLHFTGGIATSIEIWSYSNDYPISRHPNDFILVKPRINNGR